MSRRTTIAEITASAARRLKLLGPVAEEAVESLRRKLEYAPRLGVRREPVRGTGEATAYRTRVEERPGMPGLTIVYLYLPQPAPPAVAIITVTPDDSDRDE